MKKKSLVFLIFIFLFILVVSLAACKTKEQIFIVEQIGEDVVVLGMTEKYKNSEEINFPVTINHKKKNRKVIGIGEGAFKDYTNLNKVYLPDDITFIEKEAFSGCIALEAINPSDQFLRSNLPEFLERIGEKAFENTALKTIYLKSKNIKIENDAFVGSSKLSIHTGCRKALKPQEWAEHAFRGVNVFWNYVIVKEDEATNVKIFPEKPEYSAYSEVNLHFDEVIDLDKYEVYINNEFVVVPSNTKRILLTIKDDTVIKFKKKEETTKQIYRYTLNQNGTGYLISGFENNVENAGLSTLDFPKEYKHSVQNADGTSNESTLPVVGISDGAFQNSSMTIYKVYIHGDIKEVGVSAFSGIKTLMEVKVCPGVEVIGESSFSNCQALTKVDLPNSIQDIQERAFENSFLQTLESETLNWQHLKIKTLNEGVLFGVRFKSILLPDTLTDIKESSISNCHELTSLVLPDSIENIEAASISMCDNLESITIPTSYVPKKITGDNIFVGEHSPIFTLCKSLKEITGQTNDRYKVENNALIVGTTLINLGVNEQTIPEGVKELGLMSCSFNTNETFFVPSEITKIGPMAFYKCENLKNIKTSSEETSGFLIPKTVNEIGENAFFETNNELVIKTNRLILMKPEKWHENCFEGIKADNLYWSFSVIREGAAADVKTDPNQADFVKGSEVFADFSEVNDLWKYDVFIDNEIVSVPIDTKRIALILNKDITIELKLKEFNGEYKYVLNTEENGFWVSGIEIDSSGSTDYTTLTFPQTHTEEIAGEEKTLPVVGIKESAFLNFNSGMERLIIHGGIKEIQANAFSQITTLKNVILEEGVEYINEQCFANCHNLFDVTLPISLKNIGDRAFYKSFKLLGANVDLDISHLTITVLNSGVFEESGIASLVLPNTLTLVKEGSLSKCDRLTSLTLPDSLKDIEVGAIFSCKMLTSINIPSNYVPKKAEEGFLFQGEYMPIFTFCENISTITGTSNERYNVENNAIYIEGILISLGVNSIIPSGIEKIGVYSCAYNKNSITVPSTVTTIKQGAFFGFKGNTLDLSQVASLTSIPTEMLGFSEHEARSNVETVILPESITHIEAEAFSHCVNLKTIRTASQTEEGFSIPALITNIDSNAFFRSNQLIIKTNVKESEKPVGWLGDCFNEIPAENVIWNSETP